MPRGDEQQVPLPDRWQATYIPDADSMAFWGGRDFIAALRERGIPPGTPAIVRMALPVPASHPERMSEFDVPVRLVPADIAAAGLAEMASAPDAHEVGDSVQAWARVARGLNGRDSHVDGTRLAAEMPVAAYAGLVSDGTGIRSADVVVAAFVDAVRLAREDVSHPMVRATLRGYQRRGVVWLRNLAEQGGGILADDMGLGKTLQAICLLAERSAMGPHLVVCPTSVVTTWERELARFAPSINVVPYHGPDRTLPRGGPPRALSSQATRSCVSTLRS